MQITDTLINCTAKLKCNTLEYYDNNDMKLTYLTTRYLAIANNLLSPVMIFDDNHS